MAYDFGFTNPYMMAAARRKTGLNPPSGLNPPRQPRPPSGTHPPKPGPVVGTDPGTDRWRQYQDYTGFDEDMSRSDFVRNFLEPDIPQGVYERYFLDRNGYGAGTDRRAQFMRGNYGRAQQAYQNQLLSTPDLRFSDFLKGWEGPMQDWLNMSASQRGMNVPTRTQVIRWG